jgi:hypothetical protein
MGAGLRKRQKIKDQRYRKECFVFMVLRLNGAAVQRLKGL